MADFPLQIWRPVSVSDTGNKTDVSDNLPGGKEYRDNIQSVRKLRFSFPINYITETDLATVVAFLQARKGQGQSFNFTYKGVVYVVRNTQDEISYEWAMANYHTARLSFIEDV